MSILSDGLVTLGFSPEQTEVLSLKMDAYIRELMLFNKAYDLINTDSYDEIVIRHIFDSLSAYPHLKEIAQQIENTRQTQITLQSHNISKSNNLNPEKINQPFLIADIGSGGGLPGIPLAASMPEYSFILVERMSKRCAFLENCAAVLGLTNVKVVNQQAERIPRESFDIVVFRAFRPLDKKMTHILLRIRRPGGKFAAYKAKIEKITEEMEGIKDQIPDYQVIPLRVPYLTDDHERNLVIV